MIETNLVRVFSQVNPRDISGSQRWVVLSVVLESFPKLSKKGPPIRKRDDHGTPAWETAPPMPIFSALSQEP